jgi:hypothetical protein
MNLTLTETGGNVTGSGTLAGPGGTVSVTVTGTHSHPSVSLTLSLTGFNPAVFTGSFTNDNTIPGALNGSGFVNFGITITR